MKTLWRTYATKIDALSLRERAMVFVSVVAVVAYALNMLLIDPSATRSKALSTKMAQQQSEMQALLVKIAAMEKQRAGTDAGNLARRDDVKRQIVAIDGQVKDMQHNLVAAQNMKAVLQEVLARNSRVQLVAMQTLPVTPLVEKREKTDKPDASAGVGKPPDRQDKQDKPAANDGSVFKHGVQITVQGSYTDLHDYLAHLEKLPWRMFWSRASLNAGDYPRLTLTVTVYTLSLDKAWLEV